MHDTRPKREQKGTDDMQVDALGGGKGPSKGNGGGGKGPAGGCWHCGGPHYASKCPNQGWYGSTGANSFKGKGGKVGGKEAKGPSSHAGGGKGKGKQGKWSYAGGSKGKGKQGFSSVDAGCYSGPDSWDHIPETQGTDWSWDPYTHAAHSWEWKGGSATQTFAAKEDQGQPEEEEEAGTFDIEEVNAFGDNPTTRPPWLANYKGEDWIRVNYDTGASTTALPGLIAEGVALNNVGKDFVVASGGKIANYGRVKLPVQDEQGFSRKLQGSVTDVHKPLGSGSDMAKHGDRYMWHTGGVVIPRRSPVALGLHKEYQRLVRLHGRRGEIRLHREGNLYNYYVKKIGKAELAPVTETWPSSASGGTQARTSSFTGVPSRTQQGFPRQGHP